MYIYIYIYISIHKIFLYDIQVDASSSKTASAPTETPASDPAFKAQGFQNQVHVSKTLALGPDLGYPNKDIHVYTYTEYTPDNNGFLAVSI